ncbi:MAG: hypothetical protein JSV60_02460, partial [Desulfobacterales bacterium]
MARLTPRTTIGICVGFLALFSLLAWWAVQGKNATYDEVHHTPSAWMQARYRDFRVNPQDPPLWHYWAALPHWLAPPIVDTNTASWGTMPQDILQQWPWSVETLYRTPGNDADAFVNKSRAMMLIAGLALGALIAQWSWYIGGGVAALSATFIFALDPNFLANAPLVKNDVAFTLALLTFVFAIWRLGMEVTLPRTIMVGLLCGAGLCVKLSALMFGPLASLLLLSRALLPNAWPFFGRHLTQRRTKLGASIALCTAVAIFSYIVIWACYGFRYDATPQAGVRLNTSRFLELTAVNELLSSHPDRAVTQEELDSWKPGPLVQGILFAEQYHLLPEAWLNGLLYTHMTTRLQNSFLCGNYSLIGWWYYFPLAMLFKTPVATLVSIIFAFPVLFFCPGNTQVSKYKLDTWTFICLGVPFVLYGSLAVTTNLNLGLRHVLPLYPFLFVIVGIAASRAWVCWKKKAYVIFMLLAGGLILESTASFPNYLSFFNAPCGGARGGVRLLGDSNLDWGQDLKLLAEWRQKNLDGNLYLCYFGMADPAYYGIDYVNLPGGYRYGPPVQLPRDPGIIAISATHLQGIHLDPALREYYAPLNRVRPVAVLGGSIYLFDAAVLIGRRPVSMGVDAA